MCFGTQIFMTHISIEYIILFFYLILYNWNYISYDNNIATTTRTKVKKLSLFSPFNLLTVLLLIILIWNFCFTAISRFLIIIDFHKLIWHFTGVCLILKRGNKHFIYCHHSYIRFYLCYCMSYFWIPCIFVLLCFPHFLCYNLFLFLIGIVYQCSM